MSNGAGGGSCWGIGFTPSHPHIWYESKYIAVGIKLNWIIQIYYINVSVAAGALCSNVVCGAGSGNVCTVCTVH